MGEMERDGLISHGAAFICRDRLFHCSDFYKTRICTVCGSVLSVSKVKPDKTKDKNVSFPVFGRLVDFFSGN